MADIKDLRAKSDDELQEQILLLKKESLNMRFDQTGGRLTNTARVREARREVARIKTIQAERKNKVSKEK